MVQLLKGLHDDEANFLSDQFIRAHRRRIPLLFYFADKLEISIETIFSPKKSD
jgi:hypothetical protein